LKPTDYSEHALRPNPSSYWDMDIYKLPLVYANKFLMECHQFFGFGILNS